MTEVPDYLRPYQKAVAAHGGTFDATLWRNKEGQILRFKMFCMLADFTNSSILDVGCGIGDFSEYLTVSGVAFDSYHGIDAMQEMIETAFSHANRGIACNFLSNQSGRDPKTEDLSPASRFDTLAWISKALQLSPKVQFSQSYLDGHDATLVIKK